MRSNLAAAAVLSVSAATYAAEPQWETVIEGPPVTVRNRAREGTEVRELWGEGELEASAADLQAALLDPGSFPSFMPSVRSATDLGVREPDGSFYVYTQLDLPMLSSRDYAVQIWNDETVTPGGTGAFRQRWRAAPGKVAEKDGYVRVKVNDGSWQITPAGDGTKSHVVYRFATDPGGLIPAWAKNLGNQKAVVDVMKAVEAEARRRAAARGQSPSGATGSK